MYLVCINQGQGRYAPSVNTNQIHHSYTCYNYNINAYRNWFIKSAFLIALLKKNCLGLDYSIMCK